MTNSMRRVLLIALLGLIVVTNTACPFGPISTGSWDDVGFAYIFMYKGLLLNWLVYDSAPFPSRARWGLPNNVEFGGFPLNTTVGTFFIDGNNDRRLTSSGDFGFNIRGMSATRSYTDFNRNNTFDLGDATIDYLPSTRQFEYNFAGSGFLAPGAYGINLLPTSYQIKTGMEHAIGESTLEVFYAGGSRRWHLGILNNAVIFPRLAYGEYNGVNLTSQIVANNPTGIIAVGSVETFSDNGSPLQFELGGVTSNRQTWAVSPYASRILEPLNTLTTLRTGWGIGYGGAEFSVNYGYYKNPPIQENKTGGGTTRSAVGDLEIEAGISASDVSTVHVMNVTKAPGGIDTAFAIVNPTSATAAMTLILSDASGEKARKTQTLGPKNSIARFFGEFFNVNFESFSGTLVIKSDTSLATTSLKTLNGAPSASLPPGSFTIR